MDNAAGLMAKCHSWPNGYSGPFGPVSQATLMSADHLCLMSGAG